MISSDIPPLPLDPFAFPFAVVDGPPEPDAARVERVARVVVGTFSACEEDAAPGLVRVRVEARVGAALDDLGAIVVVLSTRVGRIGCCGVLGPCDGIT